MPFSGFNSMIVRLKVGNVNAELAKTDAFQFYDSPIKSRELA